jgi:ComF family protein
MVNNWSNSIQEWLYPPTCLLCGLNGHGGRDLCAGCYADLPWLRRACRRCGEPLPDAAPEEIPCGRCQKKPPPFDGVQTLFRHADGARQLIHALKFHARHPVARLLGEMMAERFAASSEKPELLIPVPLHRNRYAERGFNQAIELARPIARRLEIPLSLSDCVRIRPTAPQTELAAEKRLRNLKNAFAVRRPLRAEYVALIDDVVTTEATVGALAKTLRKAGVARVEVWACARA